MFFCVSRLIKKAAPGKEVSTSKYLPNRVHITNIYTLHDMATTMNDEESVLVDDKPTIHPTMISASENLVIVFKTEPENDGAADPAGDSLGRVVKYRAQVLLRRLMKAFQG